MVPHQANLRIIEFVAKRTGVPMDRVVVTVQKYGNMSAATVPVALVEALEEGRVRPGNLLLTPAFGGGSDVLLARDPLGRAGDADGAKQCRITALWTLGAAKWRATTWDAATPTGARRRVCRCR